MWTLQQAEDLIGRIFAPWVLDLRLVPVSFDADGGDFLLPANERLVHAGGVICGQATVSAADTAAVVTLSALNERFRLCTTVDLATQFIRPLPPGDVRLRVQVLSNGKRMAFLRVEMTADQGVKPAVATLLTYSYIGD